MIAGGRKTLINIVSTDIAYQYITGLIDDLLARPIARGAGDNPDDWYAGLVSGRTLLRERLNSNARRYNRVIALVDRVELIEQQLASGFGNNQSAQSRWNAEGGR